MNFEILLVLMIWNVKGNLNERKLPSPDPNIISTLQILFFAILDVQHHFSKGSEGHSSFPRCKFMLHVTIDVPQNLE